MLPPGLSRRAPRLALWLLERCVPVHEREFFIGDLLEALGRVRSGVPMELVASDVAKEFARIRATWPQEYAKNAAVATVLRDRLTEGVRGPQLALLGAAALLLLIALANTTNLFVARAIQRTSEVVVRSALGASRWRLTRGMLLESVLVAALGAFFASRSRREPLAP